LTKQSNEQSQDFSIHNEDFPALPGPNYKDPTSSNDDSKSVSTASFCSTRCTLTHTNTHTHTHTHRHTHTHTNTHTPCQRVSPFFFAQKYWKQTHFLCTCNVLPVGV